jgi:hypothetical protein
VSSEKIKKLLDSITGWDGYGWKDGKYIDDINEYFDKVKEEVTSDNRKNSKTMEEGSA